MRQFRDWHHTKSGEPPQEYVDYVLCHHVYGGRLPSELDQQDALTVGLHLEFWLTENTKGTQKRIGTKPQRLTGPAEVKDAPEKLTGLQALIQQYGLDGSVIKTMR